MGIFRNKHYINLGILIKHYKPKNIDQTLNLGILIKRYKPRNIDQTL